MTETGLRRSAVRAAESAACGETRASTTRLAHVDAGEEEGPDADDRQRQREAGEAARGRRGRESLLGPFLPARRQA